jgi:murein DD-endopeptidase MepM/ murein hydrolase activator NlpD
VHHAVERALAHALRRARCAPLPVIAVAATFGLLPTGGLPPLLADKPAAHHAPATHAPVTQTTAMSVLSDRLQEVRRADRSHRSVEPGSATAHAPRKASRPAHRWVRPSGGPLTSPFGYRWGRMHKGIDLGAPYGSPIYAATDGVISYAGPRAGYGHVMVIRDWDGTETVYGHMSAFVRRSGRVHAGDLIARVGSAGDATGPHLHFEVRIGGVPINPLPFLRKRGLYI